MVKITERLVALVDFVQVTFKCSQEKILSNVLCFPKEFFKKKNSARFGYTHSLIFGSIILMSSDNNEEMGNHLYMSGEACRELDHYLLEAGRDWYDFLDDILKIGGKFTRFDVALDNKNKLYFKIPNLIKKIKADEVVSRFKKARRVNDIEINGGKDEGYTLYMGTPTSKIRFRFYEKNFEQANKGETTVESFPLWNRYEIQLRDERAQECVKQILEYRNLSYVAKGVLSYYVTIKNRNPADSNKRRWETWRPWKQFLGDAEKIKLGQKPEIKTLEDNLTWQIQSNSNSLLMLKLAGDSVGVDFIDEILKRGDLNEDQKNRLGVFFSQDISSYENNDLKYLDIIKKGR